jgi:protein CWC15
MTTAHRPTWKAAVGQANEGGWSAGGASSHQRSALDAPAHTKLKVRSGAQAKEDRERILQQSLLAMEEAARNANQTKHAVLLGRRPLDPEIEAQGQLRLLKQTAEIDVDEIKKKYDDSDVEGSDDESDLDAPDEDDDLSEEEDDDSDEEDDEAALQAELAKIRAEREAQQQKQEAKAAAEELVAAQHAAVLGNPLLHSEASVSAAGTGRLKRRWNDDVVFRNQAANEPKPQKRFINDTVRNDFHKRFLNKFIR